MEGFNTDDRQGSKTLIGSAIHKAKGPIAEFLLEEGHGSYVPWSAEMSVSGADKLRAAEEKALIVSMNYRVNPMTLKDLGLYYFSTVGNEHFG